MNPKILDHFKKNDIILYEAAVEYDEPLELKVREDLFSHLCEDIIGQQLSGRVSDVIFGRFVKLFPDKKPAPKQVRKKTVEELRAVGMSNAKARFIIDLATKVDDGMVKLQHLEAKSNEEVIVELTRVKGIGPWTAEMFLMFSLGRPDVFSTGDLGLKQAIQKLYKIKNEPTTKQLLEISAPWSPYRTYACCVLWNVLE